jgi:hypothetical protein
MKCVVKRCQENRNMTARELTHQLRVRSYTIWTLALRNNLPLSTDFTVPFAGDRRR